jgi:hypothetical protein
MMTAGLIFNFVFFSAVLSCPSPAWSSVKLQLPVEEVGKYFPDSTIVHILIMLSLSSLPEYRFHEGVVLFSSYGKERY